MRKRSCAWPGLSREPDPQPATGRLAPAGPTGVRGRVRAVVGGGRCGAHRELVRICSIRCEAAGGQGRAEVQIWWGGAAQRRPPPARTGPRTRRHLEIGDGARHPWQSDITA